MQVEIRARNLDRGEELIGRQGVARDITELKQPPAEVAEKSERLTLFEDQSRIAMDLYRRIAQLAVDTGDDRGDSKRALGGVQGALVVAAGEKAGLGAQDREIVQLLALGIDVLGGSWTQPRARRAAALQRINAWKPQNKQDILELLGDQFTAVSTAAEQHQEAHPDAARHQQAFP